MFQNLLKLRQLPQSSSDTYTSPQGTITFQSGSSPALTHFLRQYFELSPPPLFPDIWNNFLRTYPDSTYIRFIIRGLKEGFPIGHTNTGMIFSPPPNLKPAEIDSILNINTIECDLKRLMGPYHKFPAIFPFDRGSTCTFLSASPKVPGNSGNVIISPPPRVEV